MITKDSILAKDSNRIGARILHDHRDGDRGSSSRPARVPARARRGARRCRPAVRLARREGRTGTQAGAAAPPAGAGPPGRLRLRAAGCGSPARPPPGQASLPPTAAPSRRHLAPDPTRSPSTAGNGTLLSASARRRSPKDLQQPLQPALRVHPDPDPSRLRRQAAEHDMLLLIVVWAGHVRGSVFVEVQRDRLAGADRRSARPTRRAGRPRRFLPLRSPNARTGAPSRPRQP